MINMRYCYMLIAISVIFAFTGIVYGEDKVSQIRPADPNASLETVALLRSLKALSGTGVLFGHQDTLGYGLFWRGNDFDSDVYRACGKFPALFGWDLGGMETDKPVCSDDIPVGQLKAFIRKVYLKNGVNSISWHMDNPATGANAWDITPAVGRMLPGGNLHSDYCRILDRFAAFMQDIKGSRGEAIPIVFRPFHEQHGGWFWWGAKSCTPDEFKQLWRFTVDYLRQQKQMHNLLMCYSPNEFKTKEEYLMTYPGDDYVDILGLDDYGSVGSKGNRDQSIRQWETLVQIAEEKHKIAAITETGVDKIPDADWWTKTLLERLKATPLTRKLVWVMVWRNAGTSHYYAPYPGHPSVANFKAFENDPVTLFLSDCPELYGRGDNRPALDKVKNK
jgi:mannan endo-1,4-beta-mannosidase